jgi:hypothetical protein
MKTGRGKKTILKIQSKVQQMIDLFVRFSSPCKEYELTMDDNGRVAYAYLRKGKNILGTIKGARNRAQ